ncbi:MAG: hypothetical protein O2779_00655 [Nanoarchaeota archaeon]|nr:hypothetical protein [Nanoarchaeota archaeon]
MKDLDKALSGLEGGSQIIDRLKKLVGELSAGKIKRDYTQGDVPAKTRELNILLAALAREELETFRQIESAEAYFREKNSEDRDKYKNMKICTCGREIPTLDKFCQYCGYRFLKNN